MGSIYTKLYSNFCRINTLFHCSCRILWNFQHRSTTSIWIFSISVAGGYQPVLTSAGSTLHRPKGILLSKNVP